MAERARTFQAPKGTRDFYPAEMAVRRHLETVWREVSVCHGFDEIEGPTFEHLDLYTVKSGEEIVSELFSFRRSGGDTDYALRPEFTPTLARMYAARAGSLPSPTKWFCIPNHFRAERPQRGRLREFIQWNVDIVGDPTPRADAEIVAVTIDILQRLGLKSADVTVKISHRELIAEALRGAGVANESIAAAMSLLDRMAKLDADAFAKQCRDLNLDYERFASTSAAAAERINSAIAALEQGRPAAADIAEETGAVADLLGLFNHLGSFGILHWCEFDPSIVRGLAYYTGTVFEVIVEGERAVAGGGRYDKLIELFGGPATPAVGIAMGDVVIRLVLEDNGLLKSAEEYLPRPDAFVISSGDEAAENTLLPLVARLRREGLHVRHSYKATRNVGKLLGDAAKARARFAIILGRELEHGRVVVKDLESGDQTEAAIDELAARLKNRS